MKVFLASLGVGLLVPGLLIVFWLVVKILNPGTSTGMFVIWFFYWPIILLPDRVTAISTLPVLALGTAIDIVCITFVAYLVFRAIIFRRRRASTAVPPPPPTF